MNFLIMIAVAFALLVLAICALNSGAAKRGKLAGGGALPLNKAVFKAGFKDGWTTIPPSVPKGQTGTFIFSASFTPPVGAAQGVVDRRYTIVAEPRANVTILTANGKTINGNSVTIVTDKTGKITLKIRTDEASDIYGLVLAGHDDAEVTARKHVKTYAIPAQ